jgi:hypothetical protein
MVLAVFKIHFPHTNLKKKKKTRNYIQLSSEKKIRIFFVFPLACARSRPGTEKNKKEEAKN